MRTTSPKAKRTIAIVLAVALVGAIALFAATVGLGQPAIPDGDVAVVDDVEDGTVSQEDFDAALDQAAAQLGLQEAPPEDDPQYQSLVDQAMQEQLLAIWVRGESADRGISVTDEEIAAELETIKEQSFPTEKEFEQFKQRSGFSDEDIDAQVELTLLRDQLERAVITRPEISDEEVEDFYEVNVESFAQPASRDVRVILNESEAKVDQAKAELEQDDSDQSWQQVAEKYSQDQATKDRGGLLEDLVEGQGDPDLEGPAFASPEGELVGPFEGERGFYLIQVVAINEASTQPLEDASQAIKQQLTATRQQQIASDFQTDFVDKWTARTVCAPVATIQLCSNYEEPRPEPQEGQPVPPPVASSQPIEPGTSTLTIDGSAQQGLPQRPRALGDECASPEDLEEATASGEVPPAGALEPCGPDDELPEGGGQVPAGALPIGPGGQAAPGAAPAPSGAAPAPPPAPAPAP